MKKSTLLALGLLAVVSMAAGKPASAAFVIGGSNGWELSTDGIVDFFATYNSTTKGPGPGHSLSLLSVGGNESKDDQRFGTGIGLLPSVVAVNVKAPTTEGVDSSVRVGIYPALQNKSGTRFDTSPNIDFREFFYTAKGAYGELLVGRALNLYQGKNILTDMTLLTAGVVPGAAFRGNTTLGHIGYGYLYTNFGPQIRYTTPDFSGTKVAVSIGEPYKISADTAKTNSPRVEAEVSYAKTYGGIAVQAWVSGLYQSATRKESTVAAPVARGGEDNQSIGGAGGVGAGFSGINLLVSGYGGKGLGTVSVQDGDFLESTSTDAAGKERMHWGFLAQATYTLTPSVTLGVNYGQTRQETGDVETVSPIKNQEAATTSVTYSFNKFTKFTGEYTYAQNSWHDGAKQHSNQLALGSTFFW
ncbi:MAG: hypothetical protein PVSMB11_00620 [Desulfuromonadaceae bacterium]